ncbi:PilZ domain-containing protein [Cyanobacterium aponinum UTEX 3222]|nr:PilZ domain-containing protein [Cyanobacterium aponinum]WPF87989.1 PilZ domain-containing protein [Cyanobacterium aponinum AL20115]WRL37095.1 PilZ domain-containing protein [Cyanobacterium aponinum UTEX 3221]WRL43442.1 PilZ domain-containing protein [Cyanobacterium aponinum UTEX 3222]
MNNNVDINSINEQRQLRRILAVCRVLDLDHKFLGFTLDLNRSGIKIIVDKNFPSGDEFKIILSPVKEDEEISPDIVVKVEQKWRTSTNEEFDQIGGVIIEVDSPEYIEELIDYCDRRAKERYQLDWQ